MLEHVCDKELRELRELLLDRAREIYRLRVALADAIEEMHDMVAYVPSDKRTKWDYDGAIKRAEAALGFDGDGDG